MQTAPSLSTSLTTLAEITSARAALPDYVRRTPLVALAREPAEIGGERLLLKAECLQVTGAYKIRAACNVLRSLTPEQRERGVVLASSGNFAQAFAFAGARQGIPVVVVMLDQTSPFKVEATRALGAEVVFCGGDAMARQPAVVRVAGERAMTALDFFEDRPIIAGHASIGLEILEDCPDVEQVLVPVSSGGLAAGVATAIALNRPPGKPVRVVGVQPERANAYYLSRGRGEPRAIDDWDSIADGLSARRPGAFPFAHLERYLDDVVLVSEIEIASAFRTLLFRAKLLAEPAGAVAAAAFLAGRVDPTRLTVAVLSGGNVAEPMVRQMLDMSAGA